MAFSRDEQRYLEELGQRLTQATRGERSQLIQGAAHLLNCSQSRVYTGLNELGYHSGRVRSDRGQSKLLDEEVRLVSNLIHESARANGKILLSVEDAIEIAKANDRISCTASASTFTRRMKELGCHPKQLQRPTPHTQVKSLHPNHVWQFDVSVCVLYYLDNGGLCVMDKERFYKNKPNNVAKVSNKRVLRYLVTDHYSGALYVKYYQAAGEDQETLFLFLMDAFNQRDHAKDPFHGVPLMMVWDAGSANQSYMIRNLLDRLNVRHWAHTPGTPRSKGQVERTHDIVERKFEGRLFLYKVKDIDELNDKAHTWMRHFNGTQKHARTGKTRYGLWQANRPEQIRLCPPLALCQQLLSTKPEDRKVKGDLIITYNIKDYGTASYSVAHVPDVRIGETVSVCVNPYKAPSIFVLDQDENGQEIHYECTPIERDEAGFPMDAPVFGENYHSQRDTDVDQSRKHLAKQAYNANTEEDVRKARAKKAVAYGGRIDPFSYLDDQSLPAYMVRLATASEINVPQQVTTESKPIGRIEFLKRLRGQLNRSLSAVESDYVSKLHSEGVSSADVDVVIQGIVAEFNGQRPVEMPEGKQRSAEGV